MKTIIIVFVLFIAECTPCKNQTQCSLEDPLGGLIVTSVNCSTDEGKHIQYILYTPDGKWTINSTSILNNTKPIKLILSGYNATGETPIINYIIKKYLSVHGYKNHIIVPNYLDYFHTLNLDCDVTYVTTSVSKFLHNLVLTNNMDSENIHIIGSSLGAQLAGVVGSYFKQFSNRTIGRITGLDPFDIRFACPSFPKCRLDKTSATFVDVIITTNIAYSLQIKKGHTDFIVNNKGPIQPGCENPNFMEAASCSHLRCNTLFAESIELNNFRGHCFSNSNDTGNGIDEDVVYMGEYCKKRPKCDAYIVNTKGESPFGVDPSGPIS